MEAKTLNELIEKFNKMKKEYVDRTNSLMEDIDHLKTEDCTAFVTQGRELHDMWIELENLQISILANEPDEDFANRVNKNINAIVDNISKIHNSLFLGLKCTLEAKTPELTSKMQDVLSKAYQEVAPANDLSTMVASIILHGRVNQGCHEDSVDDLFFAIERLSLSEDKYTQAMFLLNRNEVQDKDEIGVENFHLYRKYLVAVNEARLQINILRRGIKERLKIMIKG